MWVVKLICNEKVEEVYSIIKESKVKFSMVYQDGNCVFYAESSEMLKLLGLMKEIGEKTRKKYKNVIFEKNNLSVHP